MGKRARKTRWRALDIADDHSDSEESNTNSAVSSRYSHSNGYYPKYPYSSQSTPARRRYNQYDGSVKSTRSSSTTSENKITFNEDEYTRITTPRQDVLFKKGYLNKPKNYQTQTSTGTSTISTGNSTENGTPDHQSADLDYESQFVFPNGFVDQNGIYYVNSYEPYPLMLFNPPTYYQEFSNSKSKRYSTGSLSESMSPNNEEATSQDLSQSGGEASNSGVSDYSGGPPIFNMVYPGYYVNDACTPTDVTNSQPYPTEPVKKLKKRRERKSSKTIPGDSSEYTDDNSEDECSENNLVSVSTEPCNICDETVKTASENSITNIDRSLSNDCSDKKTESNEELFVSANSDSSKQSVLKPDAEEFVPRAYQSHIKMLPPNFMPIPLVPIGEYGAPNFVPHPAFIPPGIPVNFVPHHLGQKIYPAAPGFVSYPPPVVPEVPVEDSKDVKAVSGEREREGTATPSHTPVREENIQTHSRTIDIATVVSKLEAVKQQGRQDTITAQEVVINESKPFKGTPRLAKPHNFKRNYYSKVRSGESSPQFQVFRQSPVRTVEASNEIPAVAKINFKNSPVPRNSPERFHKNNWKPYNYQNNYSSPKRTPYSHAYQSHQLQNNRSENATLQPDKPKCEAPPETFEQTQPKSKNQWISVSNRKKKKIKNVEDLDAAAFNDSDLFESYDVNQLVDVIPPSQLEDEKLETTEDILISIAENENSSKQLLIIPEVCEVVKAEEANQLSIETSQEKAVSKEGIEEEASKLKKKSKKGTQKPLTKKVIITDIFNDLTVESKTTSTKVVKKIEEIKPLITEPQTPDLQSPEAEAEQPEKKLKKKKKYKTVKSASVTISTVSDDTLPGNSLAVENITKTNDEISLELDKLIQKGMYSSLEEKIKSVNLESETDDFFKSIVIPGKDKPASLKTPDFNRIFQSTRQFLKPNMVSVEHDIRVDIGQGTKSCSSTADAANPSTGLFLDNVHPSDSETPVEDETDKTLYPITQAVKEWMSKTREATPEVEILKSPLTIQREFGDVDSDSDLEDEEVTLFSSEEVLEEPDLLEYWESDLSVVSKNCDLSKDISSVCADGKNCDKFRSDKIKQDEEKIEVYESKYGQNEAFLHLQDEEQTTPRPGQLPYRAVCCSLQ